jgi:excinuclease ABC subunit B
VGRAARNVNGKAIMYADKITASMQKTIDETNYRREKQMNYNIQNNITPQALHKKLSNPLTKNQLGGTYNYEQVVQKAAESQTEYLSKSEIEKRIRDTRKEMEKAAKELDFMQAAKLRDAIKVLETQLAKV